MIIYMLLVPCFPSCRVTLGILGFIGGLFLMVLRKNISVGVVCMVIDDPENNNDSTIINSSHPYVSQHRFNRVARLSQLHIGKWK